MGTILASGRTSDYYIDARLSLLDPEGAARIADAILQEISGMKIDAVGGMVNAIERGIPQRHIAQSSYEYQRRIEAGELDSYDDLPTEQLADLKTKFGDQIHVGPYLGTYYYSIKTDKKPWDNPELRNAISMAIDPRSHWFRTASKDRCQRQNKYHRKFHSSPKIVIRLKGGHFTIQRH